MFRYILSYFFFIPKFFPYIKKKKQIRPYFGLPKRDFGGPNVRTKKMIKIFGNYFFSPNIIYAQSWWDQKELEDAYNFSQKNNVPIVFNQNGWFYPAWYKGNWKRRNETIIKIQKISEKVIYQSNFCKIASKKLNNYVKNQNFVVFNPSLIKKKNFQNKIFKKNKLFNIIVTGVFGEESKHILMPILKSIELINKKNLLSCEFKLKIYGVIKKDMVQSCWYNKYNKLYERLLNKNLVFFYGKYKHESLGSILKDVNLAIHIKYKDPCPNAVIEKLQYGIPHIYSNSGGTPELIEKSGLAINVKDEWHRMVEVDHKILSKKIIEVFKNYKKFRKKAFKQSEKFELSNYISIHKKIFKNLNR